MLKKKIFVIGFGKTATMSFHQLFEDNGLKSQHAGQWDLDKYDCFSDSIKAETIVKWKGVEDAWFILNTRPLRDWLISRYKMGDRQPDKHHYCWPPSVGRTIRWINWRNKYHLDVLNFFLDKPNKLILVNINNDNWIAYVCTILNFKNNAQIFRNQHTTSGNIDLINTTVDAAFKKIKYSLSQQDELLVNNYNRNYLNIYQNNFSLADKKKVRDIIQRKKYYRDVARRQERLKRKIARRKLFYLYL